MIVTFIILILFIALIYLFQAPTKWRNGPVFRTPESAFQNLQDYPFKANYLDCLGYRVHYLDEGPRDGQTVLLMHGQPSWSYLYRHMIPLLTNDGYRVIAPDNVGFGKSDKPVKQKDHNYQMHVDVMTNFVELMAIDQATLFAQDWGGIIGLRVVAKKPDSFARIMVSNTTLPAAKGVLGWLGYPLFRLSAWRKGSIQSIAISSNDKGKFDFSAWVAYAQTTNNFEFEALLQRATTRDMSDAELAGYRAPYPNNDFIAGVRKFPTMVASQLRQNQKVMKQFYSTWDKPLITAFGKDDLLMAGRDKMWQDDVPGAQGQKHTLIDGGAHFIQEDKPEELVELLIQFINDNPA